MSLKIGFLGAGKMASALAAGWIRAGLTDAGSVVASDPVAAAREQFTKTTGGATVGDNREAAENADLVVLAVKPQQVGAVFADPGFTVGSNQILLSIVAGVPLASLQASLPAACRVVRVMPNTPCLVGASASAFTLNSHCTAADKALISQLLNAVGRGVEVPENYLDAVTGLSGSGPAFVFLMIEALSDGGVRMGLPRDLATVLAAQTVLGSAKLLLETGLHPGVLKDQVASPGGTTIAGLQALERAGVRAGLIDAVEAATLRSKELGK